MEWGRHYAEAMKVSTRDGRDKGKPAARRGRKATGPSRSAGLPNERKQMIKKAVLWVMPIFGGFVAGGILMTIAGPIAP